MAGAKPTSQQLAFLDWEWGVFFHFGIRTFYEGHVDWDGKPMPLDGFHPHELDCAQWIRTVHAAGARYAILVCKHHDGFANWPSAYTEYSVRNTPWRDGKSDVVAEFLTACRRYGIKAGLYYSPAEFGFQQRSATAHDDYFIAQIGELLTHYGPIDYLWFDGCGSEGHIYDQQRIIAAIRGWQPDIMLFEMWDPDVRWIGNEAGVAPVDHKNTGQWGKFLPGECDCKLCDHWFYSDRDAQAVKSLEELMGLYEHSVGRGANLLINIGPDRRGLLPETGAQRLIEFGLEIDRRFGHPVPAHFEATNEGGRILLDESRLIDRLLLREDLTDGEHIEAFAIYAYSPMIHNPPCLHLGGPVGHKRIVTFPPVRVSALEIRITQTDGRYALLKPEVFAADSFN